ncbi:flagellar basal-body rod protein FlgG [Nevskia soli]|uniref:flagellar basal-body rod protein FlgG n=1 Tax=Nevskia soli TaxID=418856 RepID=UPI0004A6FDBF|nr:flagellar basal-body rod protein FlgG [Nevskia soli]
MIDSLYIGATGMGVQQTQIDTISNNIANLNTTAFKKGRVSFEELYYRRLTALVPKSLDARSNQVGLGAAIASTNQIFTPGSLTQTSNPLDLAVNGLGFFEIADGNGQSLYTRAGSFKLDQDGNLETQGGYQLAGKIRIPADATQITVGPDGTVTATVPSQQAPVALGQIQLANFVNPEGLQSLGQGVFAATSDSGQAYLAMPGQNGAGTLSQGYLESSNVDLTSELVNLVVAQQAYQMNSKIIQISDTLLSTINSLRPS